MNEAQVVAHALETIKQDGWMRGWLSFDHYGKRRHCILGAIGYARWGTQWDIDCDNMDTSGALYERLSADPATRRVIDHIYDVVIANGMAKAVAEGSVVRAEQITVYRWNDHQETEEEIIEVLEKVQAEIGQE
jgi:hypothetical protein